MRLDIHEPGLDFGDASGIARNFCLAHQRLALAIGFQYDLNQLFRAVRRLLCKAADLPARRYGDGAGFGWQVTTNGMKQRRLADTVAADEAHARAGYNLHRALVDQKPPGDPDRDIVDGEHAGFSPQPFQNATGILIGPPVNGHQYSPRITLMRFRTVGLVAFSQFIDEMLEIGRHPRIRPQRLLEALAHSVAPRSAGPLMG